MSKIQLLDQHTINKIAAGEVVERPASVVKELVENAIDARSSAITVEIKEGGIQLIRITDNGMGIEKEEIQTAFLRHSTSKIKTIEDLITVASLGFRGEALASIASVAQVEVISKTKSNLTGTRYRIQGGQEEGLEEIGCPEGTTILVRNLFYNTPARKKFLKAPGTEAGYISELMNKLALSHPHISFKLILNNQVKLHTSGNNRLEDVIFNIYGKDIAKNILKVNEQRDQFSITGFIGKPQISRSNRNYESFYINGRYIKSNLLQKAIEEGYKTYLPLHKYPFCVLHFTMDSAIVDVNVHPTKMEVRFRDQDVLYGLLSELVQRTLRNTELIPEVGFDKQRESKPVFDKAIPEPFEKESLKKYKDMFIRENGLGIRINKDEAIKEEVSKAIDETQETQQRPGLMSSLDKDRVTYKQDNFNARKEDTNGLTEVKGGSYAFNKDEASQLVIEEPLLSEKALPFFQIIGQLFNTYWIVEFKEKFYLIDQHAAHERILFERIMGSIKESKTLSQPMVQPLVVQVSLKEQEVIKKYQKVFEEIGFEIEPFGGESYAVRSVPYILNENIKSDFFLEMVDLLSDEQYSSQHDLLLEKVALMACKAAVKANDQMSFLESKKLIEQLLTLENPYTCPHGRPTIIAMTKYELEKKFKRIQ